MLINIIWSVSEINANKAVVTIKTYSSDWKYECKGFTISENILHILVKKATKVTNGERTENHTK